MNEDVGHAELIQKMLILEDAVEKAKEERTEYLMLGAGWAHADACTDLDAGNDPREKDMADMVERMKVDFDIREEYFCGGDNG